ncbi:MAG: hypothetical protein M1324_01560 [Patescibacteria group bacterium]|nr:hypothetical protein [Actinomycetota bacterium]MCL5410523.1 hypothetical protein [Patescibacteria group bacterium]
MKKILTIIAILILFFVFTPSLIFAEQNSSDSSMPKFRQVTPGAKRGDIQNDKVANLKQRADTEIERRLTSLQNLITKINNLKRISGDQKSSLTTQIQSQITELTNLRTKIDADSDLATLKTDVKSIVGSYRIYALFMPKVHILATADIILETSDKTSELTNKLQLRIDQAKTEGKDVIVIQASLADMQAKIADAKKQAQSAIDTVTPLTPDGFPGNKATLQNARKMLQTGREDLHVARTDAQKIINGLKTFKSSTGTNTATSSSQ